jgi:hypothetical protein
MADEVGQENNSQTNRQQRTLPPDLKVDLAKSPHRFATSSEVYEKSESLSAPGLPRAWYEDVQ